ncbi:cation transporter HKT1;3-like [Primulina tabacum]|uniref:cation transporter HKT1;3-like n=1 Tax=Primulina tabacum TaxID=48773 RepID=UPI003F5A9BD7
MTSLASYRKKSSFFLTNPIQSISSCMGRCYYDLILKINPFFIHTLYFISVSLLGFGILEVLKPRTEPKPRNIDLLFTSVSAATVSSMSTVEMEVFSNEQLIVITILMFIGGEVFTSMVGLHLKRFNTTKTWKNDEKNMDPVEKDPVSSLLPTSYLDHVVIVSDLSQNNGDTNSNNKSSSLVYDSIQFLGYVVLGYFLTIQILGFSFVMIYLTVVSTARNVLKNKGIKSSTFAVFTIVSSFASCGFIPTNENMIVFKENSGLLLILIPQLLLGNTLFPPCLRFLIWVLGKIKVLKFKSNYLLQNTGEIGYFHLLPSSHSRSLVGTVSGFLLIGFGFFSAMEWNSGGFKGLNAYQKVVGGVFESANARHAGETVVDLSTVAPAVLVFFVVMMYLPPYTSFLPIFKNNEGQIPPKPEGVMKEKWRKRAIQDLVFSPLSYLANFIMAICITERRSLQQDPLNFSVLNITLEVVSAYGNVGFTTGYSCDRQIRADSSCVAKSYGFAGKWSDGGKLILIIVMFFGRLKQFSMAGGRAWKLS